MKLDFQKFPNEFCPSLLFFFFAMEIKEVYCRLMSITFQVAVWKVAILIGNMEHLDGKRRILIIGENGGGKKIKGNFFL